MNAPGITITRYPYEEPYHVRLHIEASNGQITGRLTHYCNADRLEVIGKQLQIFTGTLSEEVVYEAGSEAPPSASFLSLKAKPIDSFGHCALTIHLNNNRKPPDGEMSMFSITANVADLNRLGDLLVGFGRLQHTVLKWRVQDGELIEDAY